MNKVVAFFLVLVFTSTANATFINFDEPFAHDNLISSFELDVGGGVTKTVKYSSLSDQYKHLGVNFDGDWLVVANDPTFGELPLSGEGFAAFNDESNNVLRLTFSDSIDKISGFVGGGLDYCCFIDLTWTISAFSNGVEVATQSLFSIASNPTRGGYSFFSLEFNEADYIEIMANPTTPIVGQPDGRFGGVLENLTFSRTTVVSEPNTSMLICLLSLSLLVGFRSKHRR